MYHVDVSKDFMRLKAFKGDNVSFASAELPVEIFSAIPMVAAGFLSNELWIFMTVSFASCYPFKGSFRARRGIFVSPVRESSGEFTLSK
jgi:hypothetical protein